MCKMKQPPTNQGPCICNHRFEITYFFRRRRFKTLPLVTYFFPISILKSGVFHISSYTETTLNSSNTYIHTFHFHFEGNVISVTQSNKYCRCGLKHTFQSHTYMFFFLSPFFEILHFFFSNENAAKFIILNYAPQFTCILEIVALKWKKGDDVKKKLEWICIRVALNYPAVDSAKLDNIFIFLMSFQRCNSFLVARYKMESVSKSSTLVIRNKSE